MARKTGSTTKRFTGSQVGEISMNLTAIGFSMMRATRGMPPLMPFRRAVAREIRCLRNLNNALLH